MGSGIQKKSEYQNWITSSNKHALIDATNQLCQQKVIHLEYDNGTAEYATPTTPDIPATTNFLGIAKNGVAIAENTDGELQFYVVLAEKYLGNKDACLIYDATGKLMKNTELISNIDVESKPIVINLAINKYAVVTLNANKQPMYHIIDMDAQGYGTLINAGEVDATQVNVAMTTTTTAQYGLHFTAYEDHVNNKKIIYSTRYTPNVALPDQGTTEIVAFEFINNTTQLQQHVLYQINGCGNTEQGELQIAPEGDKLLWYQHDKYVTGFSHRVFDVYSIALHPDKISTTGVVDILDHTLVNNYGGNYGEGRAEYDADNQTMYLSQRGIYLDGASGNESERNLWKYSPLNTTTLNPLNPTSVYLFSEIRRGVNGKLYLPNMDAAANEIHSYNGSINTIPTDINYSPYHFASALPTQVYKLFGDEAVASAGREIGKKQYFLNDHLGSVRVVISDVKLHNDVDQDDAISEDDYFSPSILSFSDTYPFGMNLRNFNPNEARYSFNGKEKENSLGNGSDSHLDFGARIYDSRVSKFLSVDPKHRMYPDLSPFAYAANNPISYTDNNGEGPNWVLYKLLLNRAKANKGVFTAEFGVSGAFGASASVVIHGMAVDQYGNVGIYKAKGGLVSNSHVGIQSGYGVSFDAKTENLNGYDDVKDMIGGGAVYALDVGFGNFFAVAKSIEGNANNQKVGTGTQVSLGIGDPLPVHIMYELTTTSMTAMSFSEYEKYSKVHENIFKKAQYIATLMTMQQEGGYGGAYIYQTYSTSTIEQTRKEEFRVVKVDGETQYFDDGNVKYELYIGSEISATPTSSADENATFKKTTYWEGTGVYFKKQKSSYISEEYKEGK